MEDFKLVQCVLPIKMARIVVKKLNDCAEVFDHPRFDTKTNLHADFSLIRLKGIV